MIQIAGRVAGKLLMKGLDALLTYLIDRGERKAAKKAGLTYKDVENIKSQIDSATARRSAKTVVIPRPKP